MVVLNKMETFKASDGWLLSTIIILRRNASINKIIETGDVINHSIFTLQEINNGLSRLNCAGYISIKNKKVSLTKVGLQFHRKNRKTFEGIIAMQSRYSALLEKCMLPPMVVYTEHYTVEEYERAVERYVK